MVTLLREKSNVFLGGEKKMLTTKAQSVSIRGNFKASEDLEFVTLTEASAVEQCHKLLIICNRRICSLGLCHVLLVYPASHQEMNAGTLVNARSQRGV